MLIEAAVRVVQARDVHARLDEAGEHLGLARGGTDRGDDLRAAHRRRHPSGVTGRVHIREVLGAVLAQPLAQPGPLGGEATRSRASSSRWRVIGAAPGDRPAHREALEEELERAVPGVLAAAPGGRSSPLRIRA